MTAIRSLPAEILAQLRQKPIDGAEAVQNLFIAGKTGSLRARRRLREIADDREQSFTVRQAARFAANRLDARLGPLPEGGR